MKYDIPQSFDRWWQAFKRLAKAADHKPAGFQEAYREYYDDGDTPSEALENEVKGGKSE